MKLWNLTTRNIGLDIGLYLRGPGSTTDTEVVAAETERERESAYVSRKRVWRTLPEPSSENSSVAIEAYSSNNYNCF